MPRIAPLDVEVADEYVAGLPMIVAITFECDHPRAELNRVPRPGLGSFDGIGVRLRPAGSTTVVAEHEPFVVPHEHGRRGLHLDPGERRRVLLELSPVMPDDLAPGDYDLEVTLSQLATTPTPPNPVRIQLRAPGTAERAAMARFRAEVAEGGGWLDWAEKSRPGETMQQRLSGVETLRFVRLWGALHDFDVSLADVPLDATSNMPPLVQPEVEIFEAELRAARGQPVGGRLRSLRKTHPDLAWWIDAVLGGCSTLRAFHPDEPWWPGKTKDSETCR
jgi:hypothetical protein